MIGETVNIQIDISVHAFAEDKLCDSVLDNNDNYSIAGKKIILPLRKINGKTLYLSDVDENYKVYDFWKWISRMVYGTNIDDAGIKELDHTSKFFVFEGLRYSVNDDKKSLLFYLAKMNSVDKVEVRLLLSLNAGAIFNDDGIRYYMNSHELCSHNKAHVHVEIKHQYSGTFSIIDGEQLSDGDIPDRYVKKIKKMILSRKNELIEYWNKHTDGLDVDLNQAWGLIDY